MALLSGLDVIAQQLNLWHQTGHFMLIDYFFGWLLKEMARDMQIHYAGLDTPARRLLAQVTMWL